MNNIIMTERDPLAEEWEKEDPLFCLREMEPPSLRRSGLVVTGWLQHSIQGALRENFLPIREVWECAVEQGKEKPFLKKLAASLGWKLKWRNPTNDDRKIVLSNIINGLPIPSHNRVIRDTVQFALYYGVHGELYQVVGQLSGQCALNECGEFRPDSARNVLRDILRNPFLPRPHFRRAWRTSDVTAIARAIYEERRFADLPVLSDALEEASCDCREILDHCRSPGPHVRGCWVVDQILGKC